VTLSVIESVTETANHSIKVPDDQTLSPARPVLSFKLTSACFYLVVVLGFVLLGAINYQSNSAYIVVALVLSTAVMSVVHAWKNIRALRLVAGQAFPAFAGEPLRAHATIIAGGIPSVALVCDAPDIAEDDGVNIEHLGAQQSHCVTMVLPGKNRGLHQVRRLRVASLYPMGLIFAQAEFVIDWQFIVYPTPLIGGELAIDAGEGQGDGQRLGSTGDFHGHHLYQTGESQRRVDWRAVARGRPVLVKEFVSSSIHDCWIDYDRFPGVPLEQRLSLMCGHIISFEQAGQRYGLRLPGIILEPNHGETHYHACLKALALWSSDQPSGDKS
jgi:uncharacterized protein (DUF58 family)